MQLIHKFDSVKIQLLGDSYVLTANPKYVFINSGIIMLKNVEIFRTNIGLTIKGTKRYISSTEEILFDDFLKKYGKEVIYWPERIYEKKKYIFFGSKLKYYEGLYEIISKEESWELHILNNSLEIRFKEKRNE